MTADSEKCICGHCWCNFLTPPSPPKPWPSGQMIILPPGNNAAVCPSVPWLSYACIIHGRRYYLNCFQGLRAPWSLSHLDEAPTLIFHQAGTGPVKTDTATRAADVEDGNAARICCLSDTHSPMVLGQKC
jgi:hypothetical protein